MAAIKPLYQNSGQVTEMAAGDTIPIGAVQTPTLLNSWANYGFPYENAGYYKDPMGRLWLQGVLKSGANGTIVWNLAAGFRPPQQCNLIIDTDNGTTGIASIATNGDITVYIYVTVTYISFGGLSFKL